MFKKRIINIFKLFIVVGYFLHMYGCKKDNGPEFISDIDGNEYGTVIIGGQVWMKANLRTTRYNDGTEIPNVISNSEWSNLSSGAYCWYENDISNKTPYGALYNWYSVKTGKLCPKGWHVPSNQEWTDLSYELGGPEIAGGKLKAIGKWAEPNVGATNETGFSAFPGGERYVNGQNIDGAFLGLESGGRWCTSSEQSASQFFTISIYRSSGKIDDMIPDNKKKGLSVRCLKD